MQFFFATNNKSLAAQHCHRARQFIDSRIFRLRYTYIQKQKRNYIQMYIQMLGNFSWTYSVRLGRNKSAFTPFLHDIRFLKKIPTTRSDDLSPSRSGIYNVTSVPCVQYGVTARTIDKIQPVCVKVLPYIVYLYDAVNSCWSARARRTFARH